MLLQRARLENQLLLQTFMGSSSIIAYTQYITNSCFLSPLGLELTCILEGRAKTGETGKGVRIRHHLHARAGEGGRKGRCCTGRYAQTSKEVVLAPTSLGSKNQLLLQTFMGIVSSIIAYTQPCITNSCVLFSIPPPRRTTGKTHRKRHCP